MLPLFYGVSAWNKDWLIEIWSESKIREVGWNVMKFNVQDAMTDE